MSEQIVIHKFLNKIQRELKAPKSQYNSFGKYNYRNCEDILEAVKPFLGETGNLIIRDRIVQVGDRYYVEATAELYLGTEHLSATAYAREEDSKKGMDGSQVTGAASSYARKYALNGLFAIDDTKDADSGEQKQKEASKQVEYDGKTPHEKAGEKRGTITPAQIKAIKSMLTILDDDGIQEKIYDHYKVESTTELSRAQAVAIIDRLKTVAQERASEKGINVGGKAEV